MVLLTTEGVLALAPDVASAKAAQGLVSPAKWPTLAANEAAVWGECQGSGSKPYQTQVDRTGPAFKCSCPSRKFPCKHGLALMLLLAQTPERFQSGEAPAWVSEWLASRADKAEKKEVRQAEKAEKAVQPVDPQQALKREEQRWQRLQESTQELQRWLSDQLVRGLGSLNVEALKSWSTMAGRMVDAQAPGLAQRIREAADGVRQGEDWPERTLARLGLLQLACDAMARRADLSPALQAELRVVLGWPLDKTEVLAEGERASDTWTVLGVASEEREAKLVERRVWLHGHQTGRRALLLDHAFGGRGFEQAWQVGSRVNAELAWFPGASGLRALPVEFQAQAGNAAASAWPMPTWQDEWQTVAQRVAASPWVPLHPMVISQGVLLQQGGRKLLVAEGQALPLALSDAEMWALLAGSGGAPMQWMAEWDGRRLKPLTAWRVEDGVPVWRRGAA